MCVQVCECVCLFALHSPSITIICCCYSKRSKKSQTKKRKTFTTADKCLRIGTGVWH